MTYQPNIPLDTDLISVSQQDIKNNFTSIGTTFDVNHVDFNASGAGKHKFAEFPNQVADPAGAVNEMTLFSKIGSGAVSQLFYKRDAAGTSFQLTGTDPVATLNGTVSLPGGLILKWGAVAAVANAGVVVFPTPFPTNCFNVQVTLNIAGTLSTIGINGFNTANFTFRTTAAGAVPITYIAIGN